MPCANIPRAEVIKLIQEVRGDGALGLVVARTPETRRRGASAGGSPLRNSSSSSTGGTTSPSKPQRAMSGGTGGIRLLDSPNRPSIRSISDHLGFEKSSFKDGVSVRSGGSGGSGGSGSSNARGSGNGGGTGSRNCPDNLSGWLAVLARRTNGPSWKRCWVELNRDRLSHHENQGSAPLGAIGVVRSMSSAVNQRDRGAVDVDGHGAFKVVQPGKEPHYFKAATEAEMYMWIKNLTAASKRYR